MENHILQNKDNNISQSINMDNNNNNQINESEKKKILQSIINRSLKCSNQTIQKTGGFIESIVSQNKERLKELCSYGLPDDLPILRSLIWKINFDYLPINSEEWSNVLKTQRNLYEYYKEQFSIRLKEEIKLLENFNEKSLEEKKKLEKKTNKILLEEIKKDMNRTHTQLSFFFQPTDSHSILSPEKIKTMMENRRNCTMKDINYVQGMNEIIAPIYYCYSFDKIYIENECNIEADTFWSFYNLMNKIKSVFIREDDRCDKGVFGKSNKLKELVKIVDKDIYAHFLKHKLDYSLFAFRWFILFFSQDFLMIDILRLWDYLFCEDNKFKNTYYISLAIMLMKKDSILIYDLPAILEELQRLDGIDVEMLILNAKRIEEKFGKKCNEIILNA